MEYEMIIAVVLILIPVAVWGLKRYQNIMADGKITLDEVIDTVTDGVEIVETAADEIEEVVE